MVVVVPMSAPYCCRLTPVQTNWGLTAVMPIVTIGPWSSSAWYDGQLPSSLWGHFTKYYRWDIYVIFSSVWWNLYFQQYLYLYAENSILTRSDWDDTKINKKTEICIFGRIWEKKISAIILCPRHYKDFLPGDILFYVLNVDDSQCNIITSVFQ